MFSFGCGFDVEGIEELTEQTRRLRDMYDSLKQDFIRDEDDSVPCFRLHLDTQICKTPDGPKICLSVKNRAYVVDALNERKEKIEKLLAGVDALALAAAKFEDEMNARSNNNGVPQ